MELCFVGNKLHEYFIPPSSFPIMYFCFSWYSGGSRCIIIIIIRQIQAPILFCPRFIIIIIIIIITDFVIVIIIIIIIVNGINVGIVATNGTTCILYEATAAAADDDEE